MLVTLLSLLLSGSAVAAGGAVEFEHANNDVSNIPSLQRGARNYMNYCSGCHSAKYVRFNTIGKDLKLAEDQLLDNLMFNAGKTHETIEVSMPAADASRWFGQAPPDLSLIARSRGTDYLYTFLRSFYLDPSKPTGVNNLVLPGASMPNVLWELQGNQELAHATEHEDSHAAQAKFVAVTEGTIPADEFDRFVRDLVNFLEYIGEPVQLQRRELGFWVILYLIVFLLLSYMLKKQIWKDVD